MIPPELVVVVGIPVLALGLFLAFMCGAFHDPWTCRDCGTKMVERYPHSVSARRFTVCPVCGYFSSYIDRSRVERARESKP